jgi:copper chaperone CopZ
MFNFLKKKKPKGTEIELTISGMHCTSCSLNIDGELEDLDGVFSSSTSYAKSKTTIDFDPKKVPVTTLQKVIEDLGYRIKK